MQFMENLMSIDNCLATKFYQVKKSMVELGFKCIKLIVAYKDYMLYKKKKEIIQS